MKRNVIRKNELQRIEESCSFSVGSYVTYHEELWLISEESEDGFYTLYRIHPETKEKMDEYRTTMSQLKEYYRPLSSSADKVKDLALRVLEGAEVEDVEESDGSGLMPLNGGGNLIGLRDDAVRSVQVMEEVRRYAMMIIKQRSAELEARLSGVKEVIKRMNKQVENLNYAIQIIETYAGIKENVVQISKGEPAGAEIPVVLRQAVVFIDEEMALIEDDFDYRKMWKFDKWLLEDGNYRKLLPDEKSMIACKPRRTRMKYSDNFWENMALNEPNFETLFLVRNGANLYWLESEHIVLEDRMFPNKDEYVKILEKERADPFFEKDLTERFQKRYTRVAFLLQGIMDRSDMFSPHGFDGSFIKAEGLDSGIVEMRYELDNSRSLGDGRPDPQVWMRSLNEKLCEGKRILLCGYSFSRTDDFVRYYRYESSMPDLPKKGVYTLYDNPGYQEAYGWYSKRHIIRYRTCDCFNNERKNREPIQVDIEREGILNYDDASMEDVEYYLNSRLHRSKYYTFVKLMKEFKRQYLIDRKEEDEYIRMMVGQILSKGYRVKDGMDCEDAVREAIETVKGRLKWKRPISSKEKETYTLVSRTLFSKRMLDKYFK